MFYRFFLQVSDTYLTFPMQNSKNETKRQYKMRSSNVSASIIDGPFVVSFARFLPLLVLEGCSVHQARRLDFFVQLNFSFNCTSGRDLLLDMDLFMARGTILPSTQST
jgi:hypothetical protein